VPAPQNARYSSLAAFLAHYRALKAAPSRSAADERLLAEMAAAVGALPAQEIKALDEDPDDPAARRHRERAEVSLARVLAARGMLAG